MKMHQRIKMLLGLSSVLALAMAVSLPAAAYSNLLKANGVSTPADAIAYYQMIDPNNTRLTEAAWRAVNGFNDAANIITTVTGHKNVSDLGFWRKIELVIDKRSGKVGNVAMETYNFTAGPNDPPGPYHCCESKDALSIVNMEYSPVTSGDRITKFYVYAANAGTTENHGQRKDSTVFSLDPPHNAPLNMPKACASCHGGDLDFSARGGDTGGGWLAFDFNTFSYAGSNTNQAANEANVKKLNQAVMMTNPDTAVKNMVRGLYGGRSLPLAAQKMDYRPTSWNTEPDLWNVVVRDCQGCHTLSAEDIMSLNYWKTPTPDHPRDFWEQIFTLKEMPNSANGQLNFFGSNDKQIVMDALIRFGAP